VCSGVVMVGHWTHDSKVVGAVQIILL